MGVGILGVFVVSWESFKVQKSDLARILRFHADQTSFENNPFFAKNMFASSGFAYVFGFCKNNGLSTMFHWRFVSKTLRDEDCFGRGNSQNHKQNYQKRLGSGGVRNLDLFGFPNCPHMKR